MTLLPLVPPDLPVPPRPFREIPRPTAHPLLGHLPDWLGVRQARAVLPLLLRYAEQCGGLARVPLGPTTLLLVSDPALISQALADDHANHKGMAYVLTRVVLSNVLLHNGEVWARHRRIYRDALRGVDSAPAGNRRVLDLLQRWQAQGPGRAVALDQESLRLVGDTVADLLCGQAFPADLEEDRRRVQYELAAVGIDLQCRPWAYLSPLRWWRLHRSVRRVRAFFLEAVRRRRQGGAGAPDVLDHLLRLARRGDDPDDDARDRRVQEGLVNLFFTAHDVLASALGWCLHLLADPAHARVQDRLAAELAVLPPGPLQHEQVDGLRYLSQTIKEALRLYPGYPLFGRTTRSPTVIGGFAVPRGTLIIVSPFVTHRLSRCWPRSAQFEPERHADPYAPPPAVRGAYLPFGSGHRGCIASHLAFPLMKLMVAQIIRHVHLRADPDRLPVLAYLGTAYSETGLWASVHPRRPG